MRILLDESLPRRLKALLDGHDGSTHDNRLQTVQALVPMLLARLATLQPRSLVRVGG